MDFYDGLFQTVFSVIPGTRVRTIRFNRCKKISLEGIRDAMSLKKLIFKDCDISPQTVFDIEPLTTLPNL